MTMSPREVVWRAAGPVRAALTFAIHGYRAGLSGWLGGQCRFTPTCSHYAEQAIRELGVIRGIGAAAWRVARCNPYGSWGFDPVPTRDGNEPRSNKYDDVLQPSQKART